MKTRQLQQITDSDIKLLKIFKTVCECGGFTAAESLLGISRSAISLHMSDLESRVGLRLCQRGRAGFALTNEGKEILKHTEMLLASIEDFRVQVNQIHKKLKGEFNIGIINNLVTMPSSYITNSLKQLNQEHNEVKVNISLSTLNDIECRVMDGRLHIGAIPYIAPLSGLEYLELYEEKSSLYCGNNHPLFQNSLDLEEHDLLHWTAIMPSHVMTAEAIQLHKLLKCTATASDREGVAFLILTGNYLGFLPDHYAQKWVVEGRMKKLLPEKVSYSTPICAITKKSNSKNMILKYFINKLRQNIHTSTMI